MQTKTSIKKLLLLSQGKSAIAYWTDGKVLIALFPYIMYLFGMQGLTMFKIHDNSRTKRLKVRNICNRVDLKDESKSKTVHSVAFSSLYSKLEF
ncbi:hypothetical protein L596_020892 [Steinernema carpocapsae]|uniref:Uncharacterized protein n=1 Tax=Steinernema carpocapsae TaxID=34508 RepID=A0A4V6A113_STECR|nr:hypothetical protein L596_020892 [Steinernema carpocapsae]